MPLVTYTTVCLKKTIIARGVYELRITRPAGFTFKAGQFVLFDVPLVENRSDVQTRALSIASTAEESDLLFVVKLLPGGRLSRWIEELLAEGSSVTFKGPFGNFTLKPDGDRDLLFVATGAGIAPFRPMVEEALTKNPHPYPSPLQGRGESRRIDLLFGVRSEEDLFWKEWLEGVTKAHPNVFAHIALSQPSASWTGHRGRVQAVAPRIVGNDFARKTLYVCGNPDMTSDLKRLALGEWGMEKGRVHVEGYI